MTDTHLEPDVLASLADPGIPADRGAADHLASCARCSTDVAEMRALRSALSELPDLTPSRPLRFLPPVPEPAPRRSLSGWRRAFVPLVTAGAVLLVVGSLGTLNGMAGSAGAAPELATDRNVDSASYGPEAPGVMASQTPTSAGGGQVNSGNPPPVPTSEAPFNAALVWALVALFGMALIIGAVVLRFVVVPRAG